jgi:hypothetical protein
MRFPLPLLVICLLASTALAQTAVPKSPLEEAFSRLEYRSIGPAIMGGRIADVEGVPGDANVVYVASASGGLVEDDERRRHLETDLRATRHISIGDIALAPSNPDVVWVAPASQTCATAFRLATVFTSRLTAARPGSTWVSKTRNTSPPSHHPQNPDIVYIGALGHAFGPNEERGVFHDYGRR